MREGYKYRSFWVKMRPVDEIQQYDTLITDTHVLLVKSRTDIHLICLEGEIDVVQQRFISYETPDNKHIIHYIKVNQPDYYGRVFQNVIF